jgi:hypothetical protein
MATTTLSSRNTPTQTQGTVEPIKVTAVTQGAQRSQVGMSPRVEQTPSTQPVEPPKSPTVTEDPLISSKFAALARKEKAIRQRQLEIQQKEREMVNLNEEISKAKAYRERLKSNPLDVLNEEGITYDQLVQEAVNPRTAEMTALQAQIKSLEDSLKRNQEESQKAYDERRNRALSTIRSDVNTLVSSDPAYETIKDMGMSEAVTHLIDVTEKEDGILLTIDKAAKQVNDYLLAEIDQLTSIPSVKKRLQPQEAQQPQEQAKAQAPQQTGMKTLSHSMTPLSEAPAKNWAQRRAQLVAKYSKKA